MKAQQDFAQLFNDPPPGSGLDGAGQRLNNLPSWGQVSGGGYQGGGGSFSHGLECAWWRGGERSRRQPPPSATPRPHLHALSCFFSLLSLSHAHPGIRAPVYITTRYVPKPGFLSFFTGSGATYVLNIVLNGWEARVRGWGPAPIYRSGPVAFSYSWNFYSYLWYANNYGSWAWKSPPLGLVMTDQYNNAILTTVRVTLNLKTSEIYSTRITDVQWWGNNNWGQGYVDVNGK